MENLQDFPHSTAVLFGNSKAQRRGASPIAGHLVVQDSAGWWAMHTGRSWPVWAGGADKLSGLSNLQPWSFDKNDVTSLPQSCFVCGEGPRVEAW